MKKLVIFNVGGAFSAYLELDENKIVIDLGKSDEFNPVTNFLLPLAERKFGKSDHDESKYHIEQAFLSHLDNDHISSIEDFDEFFNPHYLTTPCEHPRQEGIFNIILDFFTDENENRDKVLELMRLRLPGYGREIREDYDNPLIVHENYIENVNLYYIPAGSLEEHGNLKEKYSNNTSLVLFLNINGHTVLIPGDVMDDGMEYLINNNSDLLENLQMFGVDFLIAPHHGLETSFPESLFKTVKGGKINRLNIIPEKRRSILSLENRSDVDGRYYSDNYCLGDNDLGQKGVKTSNGHIVIDFSMAIPCVKRVDTENLLAEFI